MEQKKKTTAVNRKSPQKKKTASSKRVAVKRKTVGRKKKKQPIFSWKKAAVIFSLGAFFLFSLGVLTYVIFFRMVVPV